MQYTFPISDIDVVVSCFIFTTFPISDISDIDVTWLILLAMMTATTAHLTYTTRNRGTKGAGRLLRKQRSPFGIIMNVVHACLYKQRVRARKEHGHARTECLAAGTVLCRTPLKLYCFRSGLQAAGFAPRHKIGERRCTFLVLGKVTFTGLKSLFTGYKSPCLHSRCCLQTSGGA